ncbi:MAG: guanylate kinase [Clostridium sp.]|nr:guanylate kinase [Clostridium sp.]
MKEGKILIVSAPSGCGKSTIIHELFDRGDLDLQFSISATTRQPRGSEQNGVEYYFLTEEEFRSRIAAGEFVEYEEVYPGRFYGTLLSEINRITGEGHNVILDIDVAGAVNLKRRFGDRAMSVFIMPPSVGELRRRLVGRGTDSPEAIDARVGKAEKEISFAPQFDHTVVNDRLDVAVEEIHTLIRDFVNS